MAGSVSPRGLRPKESSPNTPLQLTPKILTPRLPPIVDRTDSNSAKPSRPPLASPEPWSYFHRHCQRTKYQAQPGQRHSDKSFRTRHRLKLLDILLVLKVFSYKMQFIRSCFVPAKRFDPDDDDVIREFLHNNRAMFLNFVANRQQYGSRPSQSFEMNSFPRNPNGNSSSSEEAITSDPTSSIVRVDGPNIYIHIGKPHQHPKTLEPIQTTELKGTPPQSVSSLEDDSLKSAPESPSIALEPEMNQDSSEVPSLSGDSEIPVTSGDEKRKVTRILPVLVNGSVRKRACSSSCVKPRQLHLVKPVLDEQKKYIAAIVEELVLKIFPNAVIEMYLVDKQQDVYCLFGKNLEYTSRQHERIVRRVITEGKSWFLNRTHLSRITNPPKHMIQFFNKNFNVTFIPLKVDFGTIVLELWEERTSYSQVNVLPNSLQRIVDVTLPYHRQYQSLLQESKTSSFLLQVAQAVFEEILSLDQLIKKILEVAQRLVNADRASLFLVDHRNLELVSTVFDLRYEANQDSDFSKKEIRIPINKGIAGHVAMSGETMNIPDAYRDERFNKAVDEATGYHTVSILCMPIKVRGKVLAVVQMVNKRDHKIFGSDDESAFQVFSTFFGLALHHAKLYDKIKRKEQKYKVALEVLGYHNTCSEDDVAKMLEERRKVGNMNYNDFALNPFEVNETEKCKSILNMFEDLFDMTKFDLTVLTRFVLTVKKNYRRVPYHNFDHGWAVANSMYVMLKNDTENRFDFNIRLALFVACLCHDLDHRGYTNKFMSEIASPLASIYSTSTLEHHHFNMTVTILQQDGHNIFYQMSSEEYKAVLDSIRHCILATDLAAFFPNLKRINALVFETPQFSWDDVSHRDLVRSFCMTGADLSASAKPFSVQLRTVDIITAEYYQQGDLERQAGRSPVPMMDRRCQDQVPVCQVGFLEQICLPCYRVIAKLFPSTSPMLEMVVTNIETWRARAEEIKRNNESEE